MQNFEYNDTNPGIMVNMKARTARVAGWSIIVPRERAHPLGKRHL